MRECVTYNFPIRDAASGGAHAVEVDLKRLMSAVGNGADGRKGQARFLGASGNSGRFHVNCNCAVLGELLFLGCGDGDSILRNDAAGDKGGISFNGSACESFLCFEVQNFGGHYNLCGLKNRIESATIAGAYNGFQSGGRDGGHGHGTDGYFNGLIGEFGAGSVGSKENAAARPHAFARVVVSRSARYSSSRASEATYRIAMI